MFSKQRTWVVAASLGLGVLACAGGKAAGVTGQLAQMIAAATSCPGVVSLQDCRVSIAKVQFLTKVEAGDVSMEEKEPDKFRFGLVTLKVEKPAGTALTLPAADLSLHYKRDGGDYDVSPCEAISSFSVNPDEDRKLEAHDAAGPGWVKSKSGNATTRAETVYVDAVFAKLEEDAGQLWICVGQPGTAQPFAAKGW